MPLPYVIALCPTYQRPQLLRNSLACWLAQDYPVNRRHLIILDDAGQFQPRSFTSPLFISAQADWTCISQKERFPSITAKYNALRELTFQTAQREPDKIILVWEDDDIYLPWHVSSHAQAIQQAGIHKAIYSKPSYVFSLYGRSPSEPPILERADGRFHAAIGFTAVLSQRVPWPQTQRADFDQMFMGSLAEHCDHQVDPAETKGHFISTPDNPPEHELETYPSYVFRYGSTGHYHGQHTMRSPDDESWYARLADAGDKSPQSELIPEFDEETRRVYNGLGCAIPVM